jgi:hypothetical protein
LNHPEANDQPLTQSDIRFWITDRFAVAGFARIQMIAAFSSEFLRIQLRFWNY